MFPLYGKTIPHAGGWYGIGILTAGPYISVQKLMLPQASATEEPRALLLATIEAGGDTIVFALSLIPICMPDSANASNRATRR